MKELQFEEVKKFVEVMGKEFKPIRVMKIPIVYAEWLVAEVERLRRLSNNEQ
ncbi:hypothetical protein B9T64_06410 [Bacillus halotolerans]|uniref:hypothetical protein n=1 Tax=Bacillus halotolerans TaxID=260554 RepID=UPI000BFEE351|nr:hypothetical protein [Bacillus halotolerans]PHI49617.1 hypothetical protein B9T64_06410 [Bacillus halotolerans]